MVSTPLSIFHQKVIKFQNHAGLALVAPRTHIPDLDYEYMNFLLNDVSISFLKWS